MQQPSSEDENTSKLRQLASLVASADGPSPGDLDRLAELAGAAARFARARLAERHAALAERSTRALAPLIPNLQAGAALRATLDENAVRAVEQLALEAGAAGLQLRTLEEALGRAVKLRHFDEVARHAEDAKLAQAAIDLVEVQARQWLETWAESPFRSEAEISPAPAHEGAHAPTSAGVPGVAPDTLAGAASGDAAAPLSAAADLGTNDALGVSDGVATELAPSMPEAPEVDHSGSQPTVDTTLAEPADGASRPADLLDRDPPPTIGEETSLASSVWAALSSERLGLAQALVEVGALGREAPLLAAAISLSAMALVADGNGEVDDAARQATSEALEALQALRPDVDHTTSFVAHALMLPAAATLALLAPGANQATLLPLLTNEHMLPSLRDLARVVERVPAIAVSVSAREVMAALVSEEAWQQELERFGAETEAWQKEQSARQILYAAATDVWHGMLRPDGALGSHLRAAAHGSVASVETVRGFVARLDANRVVRQAERHVRGAMSAGRSPIEGRALRELESAVQDATQRLKRWVAMVDRAPSRYGRNQTRPVAELRTQLHARLAAARKEIDQLPPPSASAGPVANAMLKRLASLLEGRSPTRASQTPEELLGRDLLSVTGISFDNLGWARGRLSPELRPELERLAVGPAPALGEAAMRRIKMGDFIGAELAISLAGEDDAPALARQLRVALEEARKRHFDEIEKARVKIEQAERAGRLETGQAAALVEGLLHVTRSVATAGPADFAFAARERAEVVGRIERDLREREDSVRERIKLRLRGPDRRVEGSDRSRIEDLLESGQFALAEDFLERLEAGEPLETDRPVAIESLFHAFFPERAERLAGWLRSSPARMRQVAEENLPPTDLAPVGQDGFPSDLPDLAEAWADCVRNRGNSLRESLRSLAMVLGFTDPELVDFVAPGKAATEAQCQLLVRPLLDRATAGLPQFGSEANGAYALLCLWGKKDPDDVAQALSASKRIAGPTIVLFFGSLAPDQRRRLAALARQDRLRNAIVLDEVLAFHLGTLAEKRLPALFACTLPFTDARPWAETGTPPPEMFFGRSRELRAVEATGGEFTHLIYGGRQLGKTAVLRQVERAAAEKSDTIARYVSIAEIGVRHPPEELWPLLAAELAQAGGPKIHRSSDPEREFRVAVRNWLDAKPSRHILLLLDEADEFFVKDRASKFPVTEVLRTLTVSTDRRFKPVFAGLRNVQKLARDPNSPLAHLGTPLVVGPLLRGEERRQAEALVRWPFAALGFGMDEAVVSRILAFANYYPSLIQVVCQRLLRVLRQQQSGGGPPWRVDMVDVEKVLDDKEVRSAAFERFRITLELDQRYNLLTLLAASFSMNDPELLARGIKKATLREDAALFWPAGFPPEFDDDAFEALLDEMVGLGLLRGLDGGRYALRSGNLAHLIGNQVVIDQQIESFQKRPGPKESDPLEVRREIEGAPSLLTARQEGTLLAAGSGAVVLAGIRLAGIGGWQKAVEAAVRYARDKRELNVSLQVMRPPFELGRLGAALDDLPRRDRTSGFLYVVPPEAPWDATWVREVRRLLGHAGRLAVPRRVLLVADAGRAWTWAGDPGRGAALGRGETSKPEETSARVVELTAGPWSRTDLDLWMDGNPITMATDAVMKATAAWDALVHALARLPERERPADSDELIQRLVADREKGPLADMLALPTALATLRTLADVEVARRDTEVVDATMVAELSDLDAREVSRALAWAGLVGIVSSGPHGLTLKPEIRLALGPLGLGA